MKAYILNEPGAPDQLKLTEYETPEIKDHEVLIQVKAISINPVDVKSRAGTGIYGRLKEIKPLILGWDVSGVVSKVGDQVSEFNVGDEVFGMVNFPGHGQAYAEYVSAPAKDLALKPTNVSHAEAAASTLAALTAYQGLVLKAKIEPKQKVLIHAASGGVGHFAVQIAKHLGAHVIGTSSATNRDFVLEIGANDQIDYRSVKFEEAVSDMDFVLDSLGEANMERSLKALKKGGTLVSILGLSPKVAEKANGKGINALAFLVESCGGDMKAIAGWLAESILKPHISQTFPFLEMAKAHEAVESGRTVGKVVVLVGE